MTLSQKIHNVWKTNSWLITRIPPEFFTFAYSPYERLPRAVFQVKNQTVIARTNQGIAAKKATVEIIVFENSCANALSDRDQILSLYDGKVFELDARKENASFALVESNVTHDNGIWKADIAFDVKIIHL